jgi:23S rRNA (adenine2030-N6)-methyltransferase
LPRKLKLLCQPINKPWLHATLAIGRANNTDDKGLSASGMFVVNPPHTLKGQLQAALAELEQILGRGPGQGFSVESGG